MLKLKIVCRKFVTFYFRFTCVWWRIRVCCFLAHIDPGRLWQAREFYKKCTLEQMKIDFQRCYRPLMSAKFPHDKRFTVAGSVTKVWHRHSKDYNFGHCQSRFVKSRSIRFDAAVGSSALNLRSVSLNPKKKRNRDRKRMRAFLKRKKVENLPFIVLKISNLRVCSHQTLR